MFSQLLALSAKDLLGLSVLGAIVTTLGALIALVIKEFFFARSFEVWKAKRTLEGIFQKYKDPLVLAADELSIRLKEICEGYGSDYLSSNLLDVLPDKMQEVWAFDSYYQRYKLESTIYRLCALFGWFELYRLEVVFLRNKTVKHNRALEEAVAVIREVLADGQINASDDWQDWKDHLIFREEQRAIGATMIVNFGNDRTIMGYGEFSELMRKKMPTHQYRWVQVAAHFLLDISPQDKDFRAIRIKVLYVHLIDLIKVLDATKIRDSHRATHKKYFAELPEGTRKRLTFEEMDTRISWIYTRKSHK